MMIIVSFLFVPVALPILTSKTTFPFCCMIPVPLIIHASSISPMTFRLNDFEKCHPRDNAFRFLQKFLFVGSGCTKLIVHFRQCHLSIFTFFIPYCSCYVNCTVLPYLLSNIYYITMKRLGMIAILSEGCLA